MSRERNKERYHTDAEFLQRIIERAKISMKNKTYKRMNQLKI